MYVVNKYFMRQSIDDLFYFSSLFVVYTGTILYIGWHVSCMFHRKFRHVIDRVLSSLENTINHSLKDKSVCLHDKTP